MHVWDDKFGHQTFRYKKYAYTKSVAGTYLSLYGDRLKRITQWEKEQNVKLQELTDSWGIEKAGLQQQLGGLENQVGNLNLTIGASEAQNRAYANELKTLQEANIKATERERLIARYGSALQGAPEDPKVHGVKTAKIKDQPNQRWYTPRNQFNRTGMRITNLNI